MADETPVSSSAPEAAPTDESSVPMTDAPPDDGDAIHAFEPRDAEPIAGSAQPETEVDQAEAGEQPVQQYTDAHYRWGQYLGLSKEQVDATPPQALESVIHATHARIQAESQRQAQWQAAQQQRQPPQQPQQQWAFQPLQPVPVPQVKPEERENYDPAVLALIDATAAQNERFMQMQSYLNSFALNAKQIQSVQQREVQDRATESQYREFDRITSEIDAEAFGQGRLEELQDQTHRQNRDMLAMTVRRMAAGHRALGEEVPPISALVHSAYAMVFGDKIRTNTVRNVARAAKNHAAQSTAKPTKRTSRPMNDDEISKQVIKEWLAENTPSELEEAAVSN